MTDDNLPVGPTDDDGKKLPARPEGGAGATLSPHVRQQPLSVEMFGDDSRDDSDEIDLLSYWRILLKRRWLILGVLAAGIAVSLLITLQTTPMYRATAVMQIEKMDQQTMQVGNGQQMMYSGWDPDFIETQSQLLRSRALAERVANELKLDDTALDRLQQPSPLGRLMASFKPAAKPAPKTSGGDAKAQLRRATAVVQSGLTVSQVPNSSLVNVSFDSPVPSFSARVANAVTAGFIASGMERKFGATSYAKTYLEDQLRQTKSKLEDSERQLVSFAQKENIVAPDENGNSLVGQNLSELNSALATAQSQRIRAQARWNEARAASGSALPADMLTNSILRTLQQQKADLQGQYQQKLQVYKPEYPAMKQLKGQMDELDKQISRELSNIRASVKAEYDAAMSQENLLKGQLATLRGETLDVDSRSIQYNILKREVDTNRQLYDSLLQRYKQIGVTANLVSNNISVVDRALAPVAPFKPNLIKNVLLGLLAGLILGVLLAFVLEFLDVTIKTPDDVEQRLRLPVLGIIPKLGAKQSIVTAQGDPRSAFSESYRSVRTSLQFSTERGVPRVLLLTSPGGSEGKSTSAVSLARNFAQLGKRVLLLEADLRNPSLHKVFGQKASIGLSNLLAGDGSILSAVMATDQERLSVILAGPLPPNPAELLSSSKLVSLLTVAMQHYDQIIIDGPPVLGIADAPILSSVAEGTLLILHSGKTKIDTGQAAVKRLMAARARVIGALLTMYDTKAAGSYGYGYDYYAYGNTPKLTGR